MKKQRNFLSENEIEESVCAFQKGDQLAFKKLEPFLERVINASIFVKRYPGFSNHIEDLRQECWIEFLSKLKHWDPKRGPLKNFLFKCFSNRALHYLYREELQEEITTSLQEHAPEPNELSADSGFYIKSDEEMEVIFGLRLNSFTERYIVMRVFNSLYLKIFHRSRGQLLRELRVVTGLTKKRINFLMHYSMVVIRKTLLEKQWSTSFEDSV